MLLSTTRVIVIVSAVHQLAKSVASNRMEQAKMNESASSRDPYADGATYDQTATDTRKYDSPQILRTISGGSHSLFIRSTRPPQEHEDRDKSRGRVFTTLALGGILPLWLLFIFDDTD
eukprot:scaffold387_cov98-Skeletonema_dohrnii-CCMP3373.AAC.1